MDKLKYTVDDPIVLQGVFSNIFESEVTATSVHFGASPDMIYMSPLLSIYWGEYAHFCGRWMTQGIYVTISVDPVNFVFNGHEIGNLKDPLEVTISLPGVEHDYSFVSNIKALILFIDPALLKPMFQSTLERKFDESLTSMMRFKSKQDKYDLLRMILPFTYLLNKNEQPDQSEMEQRAKEIVEQFILTLDYGKEVAYERSYCRYLALQAHEFILANRYRHLLMTDVCQHLNASARSIQKGFKENYGMGIIEYHKMYRLIHVRKFLQENGTKDVVKIIKQFGFKHTGRFAATYKSTFGINPSEEQYQKLMIKM